LHKDWTAVSRAAWPARSLEHLAPLALQGVGGAFFFGGEVPELDSPECVGDADRFHAASPDREHRPLHREQPSGKEIFEILVRDHTAMVLAYLRCRVWSPDAVDDLYQETMLAAWLRLAEYDRERAFGPWVRSRGPARPTRPGSR
jgi:hypothetical protein